MEITEKIKQLCYESESLSEMMDLIESMDTPEELYLLLDHYNWDDGLEVPTAIALNENADLAIAIKLYWLASADYWHNSEVKPDTHNQQHYDFCKLISQNIISGKYQVGKISHDEKFNRVQIYKFQKQNLPEVFYTPVVGFGF
jgi:hypothetical protein